RQPIGVARQRTRQDFDRDLTTELRVAGAIDFAHSACTDGCHNLVRSESRTGTERHRLSGDEGIVTGMARSETRVQSHRTPPLGIGRWALSLELVPVRGFERPFLSGAE